MKSDEKACPQCAEVIKLEALVCKHCQAVFSADDVLKQKKALAEKRKADKEQRTNSKIDKELMEYTFSGGEIDELKEAEIRRYEIDEIAESLSVGRDKVLARIEFHGMSIDETPAAIGIHQWGQELTKEIDREIKSRAENRVVSASDRLSIGNQYNVYGVDDRILALGLSYIDHKGEVRSPASLRKQLSHAFSGNAASGVSSDNQYGSLQGVANVTGGCATLWGILFLIITIILVLYAIKEGISAIF